MLYTYSITFTKIYHSEGALILYYSVGICGFKNKKDKWGYLTVSSSACFATSLA